MTLRDEITRNVRRSSHIIGENAVVLLWLPLADNVVSNQRKRNLLFREGRKNIGGMSAAQDDSAGPVRGCQGLGKAQTAQRRTQIGAKRDEMERPVLARTVSLGSQQDLGLEFVHCIAIAKDECDGAILYGRCQVNA